MKTDEITIRYAGQPKTMNHIGRQYGGALCQSIVWEEGKGTTEIWEVGSFDPKVYPVLKKSPFQIWTK